MSPDEIRKAREILGERWGLGRPLYTSEVGQALRMAPGNINKLVLDWESGAAKPSGPVTVALAMMLAGAEPPDLAAIQNPPEAVQENRRRSAWKLSPELTAPRDPGVMRRSGDAAPRASRRPVLSVKRSGAPTDP